MGGVRAAACACVSICFAAAPPGGSDNADSIIDATATATSAQLPPASQRVVGRWKQPPSHVPTPNVPDGPLLGNGRFGAVLTWHVQEALVEFHVGHNGFFAAPTNGISSCGYLPGGRKALGGLALRFHVDGLAAVAEQTPRDATATVLLQTAGGIITVRALVQAQEDLLLVDLESEVPVDATATLWTYSGCSGPAKPLKGMTSHAQGDEEVSLGTGPTADRLHTEGSASFKGIRISRANGWPYQAGRFGVEWFSLSARASGGFTEAGVYPTCFTERGPCAVAKLHVSSASMYLTVDCTRNRLLDHLPVLAPARSESDIAHLRARHRREWDEFWASSFVELPASPVTEFFWYMSQYLLRSAAGGDAEAPGLFGPFVMDDNVGWLGDLTLNYNAEATYYGAASSNHLAVFDSYFQTILDYLPAARRSAQEQVPDCDGALHFPGHILPHGVTGNGKGDMGQKQMGLFASVPFVLYWRYTRDLAFARRAMPFMRGVARYWECTLRAGDDALLHDAVDCAEELCIPDGDNQPDPAVVLSMLPAFFVAAADMCEALQELQDVERWRAISRFLAPYPTMVLEGDEVIVDFLGGEGDPVAWSGLFASFPLGTLGTSSPAAQRGLAHRSLERFFRLWPGGKQGNSFPHAFAAGARLGWEPSRLFGLWEAYLLNASDPDCRLFSNGMVVGCGGTGLENVGATAYINEMLLQSHDAVLRLFPALPPHLGAARFRLRAVGGFMVSASVDAAGSVPREVLIEAPSAATSGGSPALSFPSECVLASPWSGDVLVNGRPYPTTAGNLLRFPVHAGGEYRLRPASAGQGATDATAPGTQSGQQQVGDSFREVHRGSECDKEASGAQAKQFTLGGGGHPLEACQRTCAAAPDCRFFTFFHSTGYCHMFATCERGTPAPGGATIFRRVGV